VEILQSGATDYVLKSNLDRLVPAMRRAVQEASERQQLRHAESEARTSEIQYRLIFDGSPVPMWVSDLTTGALLEVNEAAVRHYGYSRQEFLRLNLKDICSPDELTRLGKCVSSPANQPPGPSIGRAGLSQHRKKDGSLLDVELTWSVIQFHDRGAVLTIANDITQIRPATEILKRSEARLAAALRIARLGSWELDLADLENLNRNELYWSDETYRIFGLKPGQAPAAKNFLFESIHPEDRQRVKDIVDQAIRDKEPFATEYRIVLSDGGERVVAGRAEVVANAEGRPVQLRGIIVDITQRQRPEPAPAAVPKEAKARAAAPALKAEKPSKIGKPPRAASRSGR
jgi:PAS domain S-box-containing protein